MSKIQKTNETENKQKPKRGKNSTQKISLSEEQIKPLEKDIVEKKGMDDDCESIAPSEAQTDGGESIITTTSTASRKRVTVTKEMIMSELDELVDIVEKEILSMRENAVKTRGIRFIKALNKKIKQLRNHTSRVLGQRRRNPNHNTNSGLLKPVKISEDLASFTGWSQDELKSRVEVTTFICKYIKEHNLQNPQDGRKIIPDEKLAKLLNFDLTQANELTYYSIQSYMKHHFIKEDVM
jgi:chromatin remodeling complex protein RSC6